MELAEAAAEGGSQVVAVAALMHQWRTGLDEIDLELFGGQQQNLGRTGVAEIIDALTGVVGGIGELAELLDESIEEFGGDTDRWNEAVAALLHAGICMGENNVRRESRVPR
jgi:hypothetical protein